jgi:hypothetical protein
MTPTMEEKLEQLMTAFSFEQLSRPDRAYVLGFLSEAEYNACRETLSTAVKGFSLERESLTPDPAIPGRVKAVFRQRSRHSLSWRTPLKPGGGIRWLPLSAYGLLGAIAVIALVWIPLRFSHRNPRQAAATQAAQKRSAYRSPAVPAPKQPAHLQANDTTGTAYGKAATRYATTRASSRDEEALNASDKYLCYDIGRPAGQDDKNGDMHGNQNSPGLHSNLLIPEVSPVEARPHLPRSRD